MTLTIICVFQDINDYALTNNYLPNFLDAPRGEPERNSEFGTDIPEKANETEINPLIYTVMHLI